MRLSAAQLTQVQDKNGKRTYYPSYFADSGQRVYEENRKHSVYLKLNQCSPTFFNKLEETIKAKIRRHSVDTFVQEYKAKHPTEIVPSTKTVYRYILSGLISIKPIDLPKMVSIRKRTRTKTTVNKKTLGKFIEERPETVNNRSEFGHWEIDLVLGKKTKGEAVVMTLVERQTRFALAYKLPNKEVKTINEAVQGLIQRYPIASITTDNGSEFSLLSELTDIEVYFAHPYSSHERGSNENFNGLLREFLPKGKSLNPLTDEELAQYLSAINDRPRRFHCYKTSKFLFGLAQTA